ncbi:MAG TPA: HAMP domain-containing methyl-accepting chemotaxis protein [Polyangiaceae bacterium]|nr:HAMP domain-containing methyl-accepting chemotaxis protein [Polyangiaceae bacterium]
MLKTLTLRSILTYAVLDLLFAPFVILAFTQLLGTGGSTDPMLTLALLTAVKVAAWASYLSYELSPWERFARTAVKGRTPELTQSADRSLQTLPLRFAIFYGLTWIGTYATGFMLVKGYGPERMPLPPQADNAVGILCAAVFFGGFAFAYPLASTLTADAASECSALARAGRYSLDRRPSSLQLRIAVVAVSLGLGPMLWMVALGYIKQVEASHNQRATQTALASSELALAISGVDPARGEAGLDAVLASFRARNVEGFVLSGGKPQGDAASRLLSAEPDVQRWLEAEATHQIAGLRARIDLPNVIAFHRVDAQRVAVAVVRTPVSASSSFVWSSIVFTILVCVWAPVCAYALGRAVSRPIGKLTAISQRIVEQGDLKEIGTVPVATNDEIGVLTDRVNDVLDLMRDVSVAAHAIAKGDLRAVVDGTGELPDSFRGMLESLRGMVQQIRETAVDLASAAAEIFAASQEQEAAAASQSSAMVEISRTMDSLSESAAHVSDAVQGVLGNAERTLHNTDDMVRRIGELTGHANRIGEILEVIRDIADRSDLLALNGSLEASHAGEGGRGFALVASEMRRLAERVTASVTDVKKLVSDIRDSGSSTVMATEESKKLAEGTTDAARQITFVTQQQRSGTEQVSQSIKGIADVVSQAVSATSQTRTSAQGLKTQADRLSALVKRFELTPEAH